MIKQLFTLITLVFFSCSNETSNINELKFNTDEKSGKFNVDSIDTYIKNLGRKTVTVFHGDTLVINLYVNNDDYVSKNYIDVLCEVIIVELKNHFESIENVVIVETLESGLKNQTPILINESIVKSIISSNNLKINYDFKKYIVQNIRGEKMGKLNMIIEHIISGQKNQSKIPLKEYDFITLIKLYASEYCMSTNKNEFYRKLLFAIKETAYDKELWPDFNPRDIDYFLDYCNNDKMK